MLEMKRPHQRENQLESSSRCSFLSARACDTCYGFMIYQQNYHLKQILHNEELVLVLVYFLPNATVPFFHSCFPLLCVY